MSTDTSSKRAEANRRNAARSTGPRSAIGKDRSRFNAVKHGMAAKLPVLPGEDADAFRAHRDAWTAELRPRGQVERQLVDRAVHVSWQLQRVDRAQAARLASEAQAAGARLAADQSDEVLALGRRLFWDPLGPLPLYPHLGNWPGRLFVRFSWSKEIDDPNEPARVLNRLESTAIGCAWLLDRWGELRARLEDGWTLQPPERLKAIRLLGRQPMDAPQDDRVMMIYLACWAMDLNGPHGFDDLVNELQPAELKLWIDRLDDREAMDRRPADRASGKAELLKIVAAEEERLEEVLELHLERDEAGGLEPLLFDDSESGERLRRYQLACNRTLLRILDTLERRQRARGKARAEPTAAIADRPTDIVPPAGVERGGWRVEGAAADPPDVIVPPLAAASNPQDTAGAPIPEDPMPAIDEPEALDDEPADAFASAGPADECPAPAEIAAPVKPVGAATVMKLPRFPGETAVEGQNLQNEPNEPAVAAGGRALDGLAALLALLKLAVVVLFAAASVVKRAWAMALEGPFRKAGLAVVGWAQPGDTKAESRDGWAQEPGRADEVPGTRGTTAITLARCQSGFPARRGRRVGLETPTDPSHRKLRACIPRFRIPHTLTPATR